MPSNIANYSSVIQTESTEFSGVALLFVNFRSFFVLTDFQFRTHYVKQALRSIVSIIGYIIPEQ